ncbi:MAG: hypothetical protein EOO96_16365 [Pedobacter sp.]|nr:MAG: hypothetical protein EOO96_16365 [Pedobacter sp.]
MKKLIYTVALVVMGITASYAQKPERQKLTAEERADKFATAMQQRLSLTEDQKLKVKQLELDRAKQNDELRKKDGDAIKGKMEERKALNKAHQDKLDAILTPEQRTKLAASREEMKSKMKDRKGDKGDKDRKGPRPEKGTPPPPANNN